jgi:ABC-type Fe3+-hydroxamate transport system substrate-binding protein
MKIISLVPSVTETLYTLGLEDQILAISRFCVLPADRVQLKPKVGGTKNPKLQKILEMKPDIVILNEEENRKEDADFLREHGIRLYVSFPRTMLQAAQMVEEMGRLFNATEKASELVGEIRNRMVTYQAPYRKRTLILIWRRPYMTVNRETYVDDVCRFFGFDNVFLTAPERYPRLTDQEINAADPEVVLFPDEPYPFRDKHVEEFRNRFPDSRAVRRNRLLLFNGTYVAWHGFGTLRALREFPALLQRLWE